MPTGSGAYAAEVYHQWALKQGIAEDEIKRTKDLLRIAAMLHDLGKVAISDLILKKPDRLDSGRIPDHAVSHDSRGPFVPESGIRPGCPLRGNRPESS